MSDHIEIEKIILKIGKKSVELSPQEAKELKDVLNNLLGHPISLAGHQTWIYYPQPYHPLTYPNWGINTSGSDVVNGTITVYNTNYSKGAKLDGPDIVD